MSKFSRHDPRNKKAGRHKVLVKNALPVKRIKSPAKIGHSIDLNVLKNMLINKQEYCEE